MRLSRLLFLLTALVTVSVASEPAWAGTGQPDKQGVTWRGYTIYNPMTPIHQEPFTPQKKPLFKHYRPFDTIVPPQKWEEEPKR